MVEVTELDDLKCQFLYQAEGTLHLMDPESFEMYEVPASVFEGNMHNDAYLHQSLAEPLPISLNYFFVFFSYCRKTAVYALARHASQSVALSA
jgi:hypothetical protein